MRVADDVRAPGADPDAALELLIKEARARARRRLVRRIGTASLVAGLFAGGLITVGGGSDPTRSANPDAGPPPPPARLEPRPRFFADAVATAEANTLLQVRRSASGRLVEAQLRVPRDTFGQVLAVAATGPDRFVVAFRKGSASAAYTTSCQTQLYRLRLNSNGRFQSLTPIRPVLQGYVGSLAVSAGGRMLGYSLIDSMCFKGAPNYLGVLDAATGRTRQWSEKTLLGTTGRFLDPTGGVSMTANGRELMFSASVSRTDTAVSGYEVGIVGTGAPSGSARVVLRHAGTRVQFSQAIISPDGRSFYLTTTVPARHWRERSRLLVYRTGASVPYATLATSIGMPDYGAALDPSGQWLLLPYKLDQGTERTHWRGGLQLLSINTVSGKRSRFFVPLTGFGTMSPPGGMFTAW